MKIFKILNKERPDTTIRIFNILLENRGIKTKKEVDEFLDPQIEKVTVKNVGIDVSEIKKALELIKKTIQENKAIIIFGDYDVDGITGTAILWETIFSFYKNVHPYIPHRMDEGYGLSIKGIKNLQVIVKDIGLIITVDNGIVAGKAVEYAKSNGIQVVITDHHTPGDILPDADAIIHTTSLCGAGVGYLFSQTIRSAFQLSEDVSRIELVVLATVADLVPLNAYNRTLLKFGLEKLRNTNRVGLLALFEEAKINKSEIDTYHIGHMIAPRLNASGRISHAMDGLRLICTTNKVRAKKLAMILEGINKERQALTFSSAEDAKQHVKDIGNIVIAESSEYEQGVVGLIASRLVEEFYRPSLAISIGQEISKGSARSIPGVNIIELIRSCPDYLIEAGGHPMAAGFSMKTKNLDSFKKAIVKASEKIEKKLFVKELKIDLEIEFGQITLELYDLIKKLAPFGMGNPVPVFMTKKVQVLSLKKVGKQEDHLQMFLGKDGVEFKGILFNHIKKQTLSVGDIIDVIYTIEQNIWKDKKTIELKVKDFKNNLLP